MVQVMKASAVRKLEPPAPDPEVRTPESFIEEIVAALGYGAEERARKITEQGLTQYPDHEKLLKYRHFLRPARSRVVPGPTLSDPRPSYEWIKRHSREYRGKWVALYKGELVASSESFDEILRATRNLDSPDMILHFID
jgi:uncharacterized protein DUF5678